MPRVEADEAMAAAAAVMGTARDNPQIAALGGWQVEIAREVYGVAGRLMVAVREANCNGEQMDPMLSVPDWLAELVGPEAARPAGIAAPKLRPA